VRNSVFRKSGKEEAHFRRRRSILGLGYTAKKRPACRGEFRQRNFLPMLQLPL
jgi:hypothetical protein